MRASLKTISYDYQRLIYANNIVIFSSNESLDLAIEHISSALRNLKYINTDTVYFEVTTEKCKSVIFTKHRYSNNTNVFFDNKIIAFVSSVIYLGVILGSKLLGHRKLLHFVRFPMVNSLTTITGTRLGGGPKHAVCLSLWTR